GEQKAGLGQQVANDWTSPTIGANSFASLNSDQVRKLYKKCIKKHKPSPNPGANGGGGLGFTGDGGTGGYWQAIYWFDSKGGWEWGVDYTLFFGGWGWVPGTSNRPKL